jgi:hypothetical protein
MVRKTNERKEFLEGGRKEERILVGIKQTWVKLIFNFLFIS